MKKKRTVLCISLGIIAFLSLTIHSSITTGTQVSPVVAAEQAMVHAQTGTHSATPGANWAVLRGAWGLMTFVRGANDWDEYVAASHTSNDPEAEQIFDK